MLPFPEGSVFSTCASQFDIKLPTRSNRPFAGFFLVGKLWAGIGNHRLYLGTSYISGQAWIVVPGGWENTMLKLISLWDKKRDTFLPDKTDSLLNLTIFRSVLDSCEVNVHFSKMMIKETSLRRDPDLRGELAFLARGCDFVLPSRFKKRLKSFQQTQVWNLGVCLKYFITNKTTQWTKTNSNTFIAYSLLISWC